MLYAHGNSPHFSQALNPSALNPFLFNPFYNSSGLLGTGLASPTIAPFSNTPYGPYGILSQNPASIQNWPQQPSLQQAVQQQAALQLAQQQFAAQQLLAQQILAQQLAAQQYAAQQLIPQQLAAHAQQSAPNLYGLSNGISTGQPNNAWPQHSASPQANPALQPQSLLQQLAQHHHLVAQQLAQLATQQLAPNLNGLSNGVSAGQPNNAWPQQSASPQTNPALQPQSPLQLAQQHHLVAQQLAQLAAQQAVQGHIGNPYAGQFIPGQVGTNFAPGATLQ